MGFRGRLEWFRHPRQEDAALCLCVLNGASTATMLKGAKNLLHSGVMIIGMLSATPAIGEVTALDRYVAAPDPSYRYELIETIPGDGYAAHVLEMTSQRWRDETEVDRPLWKHWLTDIEPEQVATGTALLISGPSR